MHHDSIFLNENFSPEKIKKSNAWSISMNMPLRKQDTAICGDLVAAYKPPLNRVDV
tara:strand:- start:523 stop:690 length:168 start_codon:yes stop_codon:yes gene_type:complete